MTSFKNFKVMAPAAMIELLPATVRADEPLGVSNLAENFDESLFRKLIRDKTIEVTVINIDGRPGFRVIWEMLPAKQLSVLLVNALNKADIRLLGKGLDALARQVKAESLVFWTKRRALALQAETWGAKVFTVGLKKEYV